MVTTSSLVRLAITAALVLIACSKMADACSCAMDHPQVHACRADFVIVARVKKFVEKNGATSAYKVRVKKSFKMSEKASVALKAGRLLTSSSSSTCGVRLKTEETYLVVGRVVSGQARINLCSFIRPWAEITSKQRKGFRLLYSKACNCEVVNCPWWRDCRQDETSCNWTTGQNSDVVALPDCQARNSICMKMAKGGCGWTQDRQYRDCMKTRRTTRDEQLAREP